ncbi:MAG TPA: ABC transporter substrate-binding protein [Methylomirabilota bacterium]|jgi:peptide/nickel transport system substrate-binding protein|nr:ABC transporter substrate-binding protein [Methylomirabilota bacterium]
MDRCAVLAALVALVLVSPLSPVGAADPKGELRVAIPWTPENLDPTMNLSSIRAAVGVSIFDSLVGRDRDNRIVPELAESWKVVDDVTWQFKLRRGVVFHNGEPFNAEAVRFTVQRVLDPEQKSPNRATIGEIARVDVLDDATLNVVTRQPYAPLLNRLIDFPIVPPRYTAEKGNQGLTLRPVGTGPFKFVSLVKDEQLVVEAFDRHWRGAPKISRIVFKPIPEPFTRAAALRNGEVDVITTVPPNLGRELEKVSGIRVQRVPSTWEIYLGLNALKKPLSDVRVRQALNYATDVEAIIKNVLDGNGRRQEGPFTSVMLGYDASVKGYAHDSARARRLLAEAGHPDGLEITLDSPAGRYQGDKEIAEALGGQWQKAGFKPKVQVAEWGAYFKRYLGKQFPDAYLLGLGGPMQDGDELYNLVSSKGRGLYYKNEKVDQLFDLGRSTLDPAARKKIYSDLARTMIEDATWVFLLQQVDIYATRDRVAWTPRADQWMLFSAATLK